MKILSIFRTNSFSLSPHPTIQKAVFAEVARLNHSCVPSCQGNFHDGLGTFNVHTTRDISPHEELTINYLPEHGALHAARQEKLVEGWGFSCDCPACDLSTLRGKEGEERRVAMQEELGEFAKKEGGRDVEGELRTVMSFIGMFKDEGIRGRELSEM